MNNREAFMMGLANHGKEMMVFDWDKAARLIKERKPECASAGLRNDWEWTGGTIYEDGQPVMDDYTYLSSTWAVPELNMDGEIVECFRMEHEVPEWNSDTKWPKSALDILNANKDGCLNYLGDACKNIRKRECPDIVFSRTDYIRSMSDEQMARELIDMIYDLCENGVPSYDFVLKWLKGSMEE